MYNPKSQLRLDSLYCQRVHKNGASKKEILSFCIDMDCQSRLCCGVCHLEDHISHQLIDILKFKEYFLDKFDCIKEQMNTIDILKKDVNKLSEELFSHIRSFNQLIINLENLRTSDIKDELLNSLIAFDNTHHKLKLDQTIVHIKQVTDILRISIETFTVQNKHDDDKVINCAQQSKQQPRQISQAVDGYKNYIWPDMSEYIGYWVNNLAHGYGIRVQPGNTDQSGIYIGNWQNGKQSGIGIYDWADGTQYIGSWCDGCRHGLGMQRFGTTSMYNGDFYYGYFRNNKPEGKGIWYYLHKDIFIGEWLEGLKHGIGYMILYPKQEIKVQRYEYDKLMK